MLAGKAFAFGILRRQIQIEFQAAGGFFRDGDQADFVHVVCGLAGAVLVLILDLAVDIGHFSPGKNGFETVQDDRIPPLDLIGPAAAGLVGFLRHLIVVAGQGGLRILFLFRAVSFPVPLRALHRPEQKRHERAVMPPRLPLPSRVPVVENGGQQCRIGAGRSVAEEMADTGFHRGFLGRQVAQGPFAQESAAQGLIAHAQAGETEQHPLCHPVGVAQEGDVPLQGIGGQGGGLVPGAYRPGGQPEIQIAVEGGFRQGVDDFGQEQVLVRQACLNDPRLVHTQFFPPAQPVGGGFGANGLEGDAMIAPEPAIENAQPPLEAGESHGRLRMAAGRGPPDQTVPQGADGLLGFEEMAEFHLRSCPPWRILQPMTAWTTSRSPDLTSSSSLSGSIRATSMACSIGMPAAIRLAQ